jgi:putative ABC transport system permease protein
MIKNYIKIAWKVLLRRKFFTFVSLFGISFTLLVLMVVAALVDHLVSPAQAGSKFDRCLHIMRIEAKSENSHVTSYPSYFFLDRYVKPMNRPEVVSIHSNTTIAACYVRNRKIEFELKFTDEVFWDIMGFEFVEGRAFDKNMVDNADHVAVITDRTRRQLFGDEPAVGKYIETTGGNYRVVGVVPHEDIPFYTCYGDIYAPITASSSAMSTTRLFSNCSAFVLARDKSEFDLIRDEFAARLDQAHLDYEGKFNTINCPIYSQSDFLAMYFFGFDMEYDNTLAIVGIIVPMLLFMAFPAINLVNINLGRIIERSSEIGVRKAFGASSRTLIGQFLVENVILTLIGGVIAYIASLAVLRILTESGLIPYGQFGLNITVFLYCLGLALFFGLFSGVLPAYRMSRLHPVDALKGIEV